jgi:hypothetical protein
MAITRHTSRGQLVPYFFGQDAVADSQTDVQLPAVMAEATMVVSGYAMPFPGSVVAVTSSLSTAGSAGSLTVGASIGGTEDADTTMTITTETEKTIRVPRGQCKVVAGDVLGVEITTASWNGTTADLSVVVYVLFDLEGI